MNDTNKKDTETTKDTEKKPNEVFGFYFSSAIKISDPETKEILLQKRSD